MLFTDNVYKRLKFVALVILPALVSFYFGLSQIWGLPNTEQVMGTVALVDTLLGALLGLSTRTYNSGQLQQPKKYDGVVTVDYTAGGAQARLHDIDADAIETKSELLLRILPPG